MNRARGARERRRWIGALTVGLFSAICGAAGFPQGQGASPSETPLVSDIAPFSAAPGTTIKATIRGTALDGASAVTFEGAGITAQIEPGGTGSTVVVTIAVGGDANPGSRAFSVTTPGGRSPRFAGLAIIGGVLTEIAPACAVRGAAVPVRISGRGLLGVSGGTVSGAGITAIVTATSDRFVDALITAAPDAPLGKREI